MREPIEVRVLRDELAITSLPGPDRAISMKALTQGRLHARRYRNRRIGEFLKELKLTEGRGTGIPKVIRAMRENGSPLPRFETDENRDYFTAILPLHPNAQVIDLDSDLGGKPSKSPSKSPSKLTISDREKTILDFCRVARSRAEIQEMIGLKHVQNFRMQFLWPLLGRGWIEMTRPESPTSRLQQYRTTTKGLKYLESETS